MSVRLIHGIFRATKGQRFEGCTATGESGGISERKWLAALDDFRNWLIREAA
jgi:hypothetical protein